MPQVSCTSVLLFSFPLLSLAAVPAQDSCFWPSGDLASGYTPCADNAAEQSVRSCCGKGEVCLSNGLCFSTAIGVVYRGACTERAWQSDACPKVFITGKYIAINIRARTNLFESSRRY